MRSPETRLHTPKHYVCPPLREPLSTRSWAGDSVRPSVRVHVCVRGCLHACRCVLKIGALDPPLQRLLIKAPAEKASSKAGRAKKGCAPLRPMRGYYFSHAPTILRFLTH